MGRVDIDPCCFYFLINREERYLVVMRRDCWKVQNIGGVSRIIRRARKKMYK